MTGSDDGGTATGGLRGITEDTPGHAGTPGEAGSIDGVSAAGTAPETYDVSGNAAEAGSLGAADRAAEKTADEAKGGLVTGGQGGVTGTSDL